MLDWSAVVDFRVVCLRAVERVRLGLAECVEVGGVVDERDVGSSCDGLLRGVFVGGFCEDNGDSDSWRGIQNVSGDIAMLSDYLVREVRSDQRERLWSAEQNPEVNQLIEDAAQ